MPRSTVGTFAYREREIIEIYETTLAAIDAQ